MDARSLDLRPLLCLLRGGRLGLLLPHLPERGRVVLPPAGLEEPDGHTHPEASSKETGDLRHLESTYFPQFAGSLGGSPLKCTAASLILTLAQHERAWCELNLFQCLLAEKKSDDCRGSRES